MFTDFISQEENEETTSYSETPPYILGEMRSYQIFGLNWLISMYVRDLNGILADEMGLGKTLQSLSFLGYLKYVKNIEGPFLVVAPLSTLNNWNKEVQKWLGNTSSMMLSGLAEDRTQLKIDYKNSPTDILITSYQILKIEHSYLKRIKW